MKYSKKLLRKIYDETGGYCHICHKKLAHKNYASFDSKGAWEVDHSTPRAKGGTDRINNLKAACISCNRQKQASSNRVARAKHGHTFAPESRVVRKRKKAWREFIGATLAITGCVALCVLSGGRGTPTVGR